MSSFPDEIICHILSFANFLDVISATMVSRTWANATKNGLNITKIDCGGREKLKDENLHNILKIWGKSLQVIYFKINKESTIPIPDYEFLLLLIINSSNLVILGCSKRGSLFLKKHYPSPNVIEKNSLVIGMCNNK